VWDADNPEYPVPQAEGYSGHTPEEALRVAITCMTEFIAEQKATRAQLEEEANVSLDSEVVLCQLQPCPFCGSDNVSWTHNCEEEYVLCLDCEARGPVNYAENFAGEGERLWNERIGQAPRP